MLVLVLVYEGGKETRLGGCFGGGGVNRGCPPDVRLVVRDAGGELCFRIPSLLIGGSFCCCGSDVVLV